MNSTEGITVGIEIGPRCSDEWRMTRPTGEFCVIVVHVSGVVVRNH